MSDLPLSTSSVGIVLRCAGVAQGVMGHMERREVHGVRCVREAADILVGCSPREEFLGMTVGKK